MINPRATAAVQIACIAHPSHAALFLAALAVGLLEPTHELMQSGHVQMYDAHLAELLARLRDGSTLSLPTATELLLVCAEMSLRAAEPWRLRVLLCADGGGVRWASAARRARTADHARRPRGRCGSAPPSDRRNATADRTGPHARHDRDGGIASRDRRASQRQAESTGESSSHATGRRGYTRTMNTSSMELSAEQHRAEAIEVVEIIGDRALPTLIWST